MKINRVLELLNAERECVARQSPCNEKSKLCNRHCGECDIAQNDLEIIEMYDFVISMVEMKSEEAIAPTIREGAEVEKVICCGSCGSALYHLFPWKKISKAREYAQYCRHCGKKVKWDDLQENLELLNEQIEIVRCKDCKHWNEADHDCNIKVGHFTAPPDWFCADGEVKQE